MTWWRTYYHVVWATKHREPVINDAAADVIRRAVQQVCTDHRVLVHAIGMMPEHVHLAVSIPPSLAVAEFVKQIKGNTSHLVNRSVQQPVGDWFFWQPEYGVLTFGERSLETVTRYVENQPAHHAANEPMPLFERWENDYQAKASTRSPEGTL